MLLRTAYKPVEPREDFRADLLKKLKAKQEDTTVRRTRRNNVLYISSMLAAAAAAVFVFAPTLFVLNPSGDTSPSLQANHSDTPPMVLNIDNDAMTAKPVVARAETPALPPLQDGAVHTLYPLEVCNAEGEWTQYPANHTLTLKDGARIRAARSNGAQAGVRIADHGFLVLDEDAIVTHRGGSFVLEQGCALVSSQDEKIDMRLAGKGVRIPAGGKVFMQVADQNRYAPGGAPAPVVVVMKGDPVITEPTLTDTASPRQCALQPDSVYRLYDTPTGSYPRRALSEIERKNFNQMGDVILASYESR